jgi:hypothetical protein
MYLWKRATPYVEKQLGSVEGLKAVASYGSFPWEHRQVVCTLQIRDSLSSLRWSFHSFSIRDTEIIQHPALIWWSVKWYSLAYINVTVGNKTRTLIKKVKLSLWFSWATPHEGALGEWIYKNSTHSLTSALDGGERSASRPGSSTPRERAHGTHWIGGWVGHRAGLDAVVRRKIPSPYQDSKSYHPARILTDLSWLRYVNITVGNKTGTLRLNCIKQWLSDCEGWDLIARLQQHTECKNKV